MRIYSRVSTKPLPNDAKRLLPVEVRRSKTLLLKLPYMVTYDRKTMRKVKYIYDSIKISSSVAIVTALSG